MGKNFFPIIIVLFFAFLAGVSLIYKGLPPTHDGEYHVIRFYEFDKVLRAGDWYPRWAPDLNNGYGVPLFNYVYPLPNYVASFLHVFGVSFIDAFKLNMFFATIIGSICMYLWASSFWGKRGAIVSSVYYTFSPYHFLDIYVRGSVGEVWALAFFPAFLWSIAILIKQKNRLFVVYSGLFLALIIFSHNILALMFLPFAFSYASFMIVFSNEKLYALRFTIYAIFLGLGLSAIFWIPALLEKDYVTGLQIYSIDNNFPELYQLLIPSWGTGFSEVDLGNQMSFQIGIANLGAVLFSIFTSIFLYKKKDKRFTILLFFLCWFFLVLFLLLKISLGVWQIVPFMDYFQFSWRFLSLMILIVSFLAGALFSVWRSKILAACFVLFPLLLTIGYAKPAFYHQRDDSYYISRSNFIDGTNSPGDLFNTVWFNKNLKKQNEKIIVNHGLVLDSNIKPTKYSFRVKSDSDSQVIVNTSYFPGWEAVVDGELITIHHDNDGLIRFPLLKGMHSVTIILGLTFIQQVATGVTIFSFSSMIIYIFLRVIIKK